MKKMIWALLLFALPIYAKIVLEESMTQEEKERTGVSQLNYSQKMALQDWVNDNYDPKEGKPRVKNEPLYLSLNIEDGAKLELSDGSLYEIDPEDHLYSSLWITPFPIMLSKSENPDYPTKITNLNTGTSVDGRLISKREFLEKEVQKEKMQPQPKKEMPKSQPKKAPQK